MEDIKRAMEIAREAGFKEVGPLDIETLTARSEVRDMCAVNSCGRYGVCWTCPPGCGELDDCAKKMKEYSYGILVQTVGQLEDSFDIEAMMDTEKEHKENFAKAAKELKNEFPDMLPLGVGTCMICKKCTYPDAPCRFPDRQIASMEAFGLLVNDVCTKNNMKYNHGPNTLAYTGCFLFR